MPTKLPLRGLCLDFETTGSIFGGDSTAVYQGISFGAAIFNLKDFTIVEELYREIKFDETKYKWNSNVERIHGLTREHLAEHGIDQEQAAVDLVSMLIKYFAIDEPIYFLGHHADFDISFMKQLCEPYGIMPQIAITKLDTASTGLIMFGIHKSDELFDFLALPKRSTHNALEDVRLTIEACRRMKMIAQAALNS